MKLVGKIAGLDFESDGFKGLAEHFQNLSNREMNRAIAQSTQKQARFHEGQAQAYESAAKILKTIEVKS